MAALGFDEGRGRGSWDDRNDRPRRKRPFPSTLEEEEEKEGWGGRGGPLGSLDTDYRESPPARKARGRPWPDPEEEEEEGRRGGGRWGFPWGESGRGSREPARGRDRSRSPPRGGQSWRGRSSPSPPRESAWRSPPPLGQPSRAKVPSSSSGSCSPGKEGGRVRPGREDPKGRAWESPPKRTTQRRISQQEEGWQLPPPSQREGDRGRLERSSSSSTYRSKRSPRWEARQEYIQNQSHWERDHPYPEKAGRSGERQRGHKQRERLGGWDSPSQSRRQESPAQASSEWEKDREASPSQFDRDHRRRSWDSPEGDGKEQEIWSRDYDLEMHHSSSEDLEDRDRLTGFEDEWTLSKDQEVTKRPQGDLSGPEGRPRICMGPDKRAVAPVIWLPRDEVVDFWNQSQSIMKKNVREYLLSICPRPTLPNNSCVTPELNPSIKALVTPNQVKAYAISSHYWQLIHTEVLNMLAPAMTIYEMAAESIRKQVPVDPRELREWVRCVIRYIGSITKRLQLQCCCSALEAINPQLKRMATKMSAPTADGLLFAEDKAKLLKRIIQSFPELENEAEDMNVEHSRTAPRPKDERRKRGSRKLGTRPQDGAAQLQELRSARPSSTAEARRDNEAPLELWHRRFAHRDPKLILEMQNRNLAVGMKVSEGDTGSPASCAICLKFNGTGTPSPPKTERRSTDVLDLIHIGLQEPFPVSSGQNRKHFLTFVDDYSRYCVTYLLTEERKTVELIKKYLRWPRKMFHRQPKAFQMGDGAEGLSGYCRTFLEKEGIELRRSDAESPEPSGSARGEITSLLEMTRCMLADAELSEKFWGYAVMMATYLLNRLPAESTGKTRFELWTGRVPRLDHIRVFGSLAYAYIPLRERRHRGSGTKQAIFLGYLPRTNWHKVMEVETGNIRERYVTSFVEDEKADRRGLVLEASEHPPQEGGTPLDTDPLSNSVQEEEAGTPAEHQTLEEGGRDAGREPMPVDESLVPQKGPAVKSSPQPDHRPLAPGSNCPTNSLPGSWEEVERMPASEGARWREAARKELEALHQCEAWSLTQLPAGQEARGCKWVFAAKPEPEGELYSARLVAEGFLPKGREDRAEPFALAVQECTLRMLQGLATSRQMQVRHLEVTAEVAGELYMEQPPGFANQEHPGWVYKLKKNLFGLREAAQAQNEKLKAVLLQEGFKQDRTDPCLYSRSQNGHLSFILACAEDLVVATQSEQEYTEIVHQLSSQVEVKELGDATHFLATQTKSDKLDLLKEEHKNV